MLARAELRPTATSGRGAVAAGREGGHRALWRGALLKKRQPRVRRYGCGWPGAPNPCLIRGFGKLPGATGAEPALDAERPPYENRDRPRRREQADDEEAERVDVQPFDPGPEWAAEAELLAHEARQLYGPDHQRDRDGQRGDRDVVVDLAYRVGERPPVGEVHERAVDRVEQRHPGREQHRQAQDRVPGQPAGRAGPGQHEERDLGRGVEAEPEQQADAVHLARPAYGTHQLAEDPVEEAALVQMTLEGFLVEATPPQIH